MRFVQVDHLQSSGCKRPGPMGDDDAQLGGQPQEKESSISLPLTVKLESLATKGS